MTADLKPFQYNVISKRAVKRRFAFDLIVVRTGSQEESHWIQFFSRINVKWYDRLGFADGSSKGLVRILI